MTIAVKITGINPFSLNEAQLLPMMERIASIYSSMGMPEAAVSAAEEQVRAALTLIPLIFPALLVMAATVDCFLSYIVSGAVLKRLGKETLPMVPEFMEWRFPKSLFLALLASIVLHLVGSHYPAMAVMERAGPNLRLLVTVLFFIQGLAVIWNVMEAKGFGRLARFLVTGLVFLVSFIAQIVLILGIIDMWFDLRSRVRGGRS